MIYFFDALINALVMSVTCVFNKQKYDIKRKPNGVIPKGDCLFYISI